MYVSGPNTSGSYELSTHYAHHRTAGENTELYEHSTVSFITSIS